MKDISQNFINFLALLSLVAFTAVFSPLLLAVDCISADITLASQVEVDAFQTNYGGGGICDTVTGGLRITGGSVIDLSPLSALVEVMGDVEIDGVGALTNLDGLSELVAVGGRFKISNIDGGDALINIDGLSALTTVGGDFLTFLNGLQNVNGLTNLTNVGGSFQLLSARDLSSVDGLSSLTNIGGGLQISNSKFLTNLNGLSALISVGGDVYLYANEQLDDCTGLTTILDETDDGAPGPGPGVAGIPDVGGDVGFERNLAGCNSVSQILDGLPPIPTGACTSADITLSTQTQVNAFQSDYGGGGVCDTVTDTLKISGFGTQGVDPITDLTPLADLKTVGDWLRIESNDSLTSLEGLSAITSVGERLSIFNNSALTNLNGLSALTSVGKWVSVTLNANLTSLEGLSALTEVGNEAWYSELVISENPSLTSLDGLSSLTTLHGVLRIDQNPSLIDINGLSSVTSVGLGLRIWENARLTNLDGLSSIVSVGESLGIHSNPSLTNLNGLSALISVAGGFNVYSNENLSNCHGVISLLDAIDDGTPGPGPGLVGFPDVGGEASMSDNLPGCNLEDFLFNVGGSISGLIDGNSVALQNNTGDDLVVEVNESFVFDISYPNASSYSVTVKNQPTNPRQTCSVSNGSGTIAGADITNVSVNCTTGTQVFVVKTAFDDQNPGGVTVSLACEGVAANDITPAQGTATNDNAASFTVTNPPNSDTICTATEVVPAGYTHSNPADCTGVPLIRNETFQGGQCTFINTQNPVTVQATKNFTDDAETEVTFVMVCPGGGTVTAIDDTASHGTSAVFEVSDFLWNGTVCKVTEPVVPDDYEVESTTCENLRIVPSDDAILCTITNAKESDLPIRLNAGLNDAWYDPETEGQGFFVTVYPEAELVFLSWFTYDTTLPPEDVTANLGDPGHRWLTALGTFGDGQVVMNVTITSKGIFDTATEVVNDSEGQGTIVLTFSDCEKGTVEYDIPSIGRSGIISIERIVNDNVVLCEALETESQSHGDLSEKTFSVTESLDSELLKLAEMNAGLNDAWFNPETDGQGFFITVYPDSELVFLSWFTFDTELPPNDSTANLGNPGNRWLTAAGTIVSNEAVMDIDITSGGLFDDPTEVQHSDPPGSDGSIVLTFENCNSGTVKYDIPSIGKSGIVPIERIATDNVALCELLGSQ